MTLATPDIQGYCPPEFAPVKDQFYKHLKQGRDIGAGLSFSVDGETAIDLWGGWTDRQRQQHWQEDTLITIFSCTKGLAALCALHLVDQGRLDLDAPVSQYWPEFRGHGKERMPVRYLLNHRAGLPGANKLLRHNTLHDLGALSGSLASMKPWWEPGSAHGYHAITMGWLVGQLVEHITGESLGRYFKREIADPLDLDIHIGLDEMHHERVAKAVLFDGIPDVHDDIVNIVKGVFTEPQKGMTLSAFANPAALGLHAFFNSAVWKNNEQPAANGMATAQSLAKLYGILANAGQDRETGKELLSPETLSLCWEEQSSGHDLILKRPTRFSNGFMLSQPGPLSSYGPGERSFGHNGLGGSLCVADPDHRTSFAYVMNKIGTYVLVDPRARALLDRFYECL
ncbi:beta-lactamase [gamma proteobacterium HTCC5015]|nr:beta-lactamase [gamma proteobacterium HTCC5015]